jgi:hypothetical protein
VQPLNWQLVQAMLGIALQFPVPSHHEEFMRLPSRQPPFTHTTPAGPWQAPVVGAHWVAAHAPVEGQADAQQYPPRHGAPTQSLLLVQALPMGT